MRVTPSSGFAELEPSANSGTLVLPMKIAPAARSRATMTLSAAAGSPGSSGEPFVVGRPATMTECGVSAGILPVLAEEASQQWTARFNPRPAAEADLLRLYQAAL